MLSIDRSVTARLEEAARMRREMVEECPITGPKDAAKTFYWGDEDQILADAIRLDLVADENESLNPALAANLREEAKIRREFLRRPQDGINTPKECYCGGIEDQWTGRCDECGEWLAD
jgi:hypothetical protein